MKLIETGGITRAFRAFGKKMFEVMRAPTEVENDSVQSESGCETVKEMQWYGGMRN